MAQNSRARDKSSAWDKVNEHVDHDLEGFQRAFKLLEQRKADLKREEEERLRKVATA